MEKNVLYVFSTPNTIRPLYLVIKPLKSTLGAEEENLKINLKLKNPVDRNFWNLILST